MKLDEDLLPGTAAAFAELATQVRSLESDFVDIKGTIVNLDRKFETGMASLATKIDERAKSHWNTFPALASLIVACMVGMYTFASQPINTAIVRLETSVSKLEENTLSKRDSEAFRLTNKESFTKVDLELKRLFEMIVPRGEHSEKWKSNESSFLAVQRQIDELRKESGSTVTVRDTLIELQKKYDFLINKLMYNKPL